MLKGNKGEWSELYVLVSLLAEGKLYQSDINLNKDIKNIYEVIRGYKQETDYTLNFDRENEVIRISKIIGETAEPVKSVSLKDFDYLSKQLYHGIVAGKGRVFGIPDVKDTLSSLKIQKLKEKSTEKADIKLKIYDHRLAKETDLGFSIKSLIGGDSTLFNPGTGTNFIFDVIADTPIDCKTFNEQTYQKPKLISRLRELEKLGASVKYSGLQSRKFWKNLKMTDGDLPEILAYALYYRYFLGVSDLTDIVEHLEKTDPLDFYNGLPCEQKLYQYKVMRFLTECAMGMTAEKPWSGEYDRFGGVIVAKADGDIVAFHIYDFNLFRRYLLNNTRLEQAATGEDPQAPGNPKTGGKNYCYGWLYDEDGSQKIKLNLQVRFK